MRIDLRVTLFGTLHIALNGRELPVASWRRSKSKALIKLLALSAQHQRHREQLMEVLWPGVEPSAAGASLRQSIHYARQFLGAAALTVRDDLVSLGDEGLWVDVDAFEAASRRGDAQVALDLYTDDLLPEDAYEPWAADRRERLRAEAVRLLLDRASELEQRQELREATATLERVVGLDPLHEDAYCQMIRLHGLLGNRTAALRAYGQLESKLREELNVEPGPQARQLRDDVLQGKPPGAPSGSTLLTMPPVHYAKSGDLNIAYQVFGEGPIDLVYVMGWVTHLGFMWQQPLCVRFFERLARFARVIVFDKRGTGMSDRVPADRLPNLEERMDDVRAVMDAAGSRRAAIFGVSEGGPMAMLFAATYPERTHAVILYGTYAKRMWDPEYPWAPTSGEREHFYSVIRTQWGGPVDSAALALDIGGDAEFNKWWARYCQMAVSPAAAETLARMNTEVDVRHVLPTIKVPTLVIHRKDDPEPAVGGAHYLAEHIPNARLLVVEGPKHYIYLGNQDAIIDPIRAFLAASDEPRELDSVLATIVSIQCTGGSEGERDRLRLAALQEIERHRGRPLAGGSRIVAAFDGPARAVRCAQAIAKTAKALKVVARTGIHTGECEVMGGQLRGATLAIANEISTAAGRDKVLVSQTVRGLVSGSGFQFEELDVPLAGSPIPLQLFSVSVTAGERPANVARTTTS